MACLGFNTSITTRSQFMNICILRISSIGQAARCAMYLTVHAALEPEGLLNREERRRCSEQYH